MPSQTRIASFCDLASKHVTVMAAWLPGPSASACSLRFSHPQRGDTTPHNRRVDSVFADATRSDQSKTVQFSKDHGRSPSSHIALLVSHVTCKPPKHKFPPKKLLHCFPCKLILECRFFDKFLQECFRDESILKNPCLAW